MENVCLRGVIRQKYDKSELCCVIFVIFEGRVCMDDVLPFRILKAMHVFIQLGRLLHMFYGLVQDSDVCALEGISCDL